MNNLKQLRKDKRLTQQDMAEYLGINQNTYSYWENDKVKIDNKSLEKLSAFFGVSVDYILGRTDIEVNILSLDNVYPIELKRFPVLGNIACGEPCFADEDHETYIVASKDIKADFCLVAKGDSMTGARIYDGDVVFIRKQPTVNNGEIAAVLIGEEATLKRWYFYPDKNKLVLTPANEAYEPFVYIGDELNEVRCLGKAVCFTSNL